MLSPVPKRPCSRLSLRARGGLNRPAPAPAPAPTASAPETRTGACGADSRSGRLPCRLSRRHRRAARAPAPGEGAAPDPDPAPGEGAAPDPDPAPGEGAAPDPDPDPAPGEGAARDPDPAPAPGEGAGPGKGRPPVPYYLSNFLLVMEAVLGSEDKELFNEDDNYWLGTFQKLSATGQKLYVRLFQRKLNWLKVTKLNYPDIGLDLTPTIEELSLAGLLLTGVLTVSDRYNEAVHSLADVITAMTSGFWSDALQICKTAKEKWSQLENNSDIRFHQQLPVYLRRFTAGWVYTRIKTYGVEILQRLHMYEEAVEELQNLLEQSIYCPSSRGYWWNRLSLNLHQHLKQTDQAIHCLRKGLDDVWVHMGHRLALYQRAVRIRDSPSCKKWCHLLQNLPVVRVQDVPHVTIKGRLCPGMGNALFLMENISEGPSLGQGEPCSTVICSVEEVSLAYYRQQGFDQGIHGEGTTFLTLFGLLFWDIIFQSGIPDVFRNPYQACPLDLYTDGFYQQRRECIESRVNFLKNASKETLCTFIADVWNGHRDINATLVNWEIFSSLQQTQSLVSCLGGPFLSGICRILAKDLRNGGAGLPDLVVWNSHSCQYKLAEVKGPSDQLSHKQMVWLDQLQQLEADVEVCHVTAVGARSHQLS
ncbi:fanconi-associated nuclease 1 isoform X3 [Chiloscyllium punctatum]|uniref:fanconi-associated nuclease 1 isoform X3 n=1 Tax=Chiloscyllium punctatum TaxID=137246 RepID=UPI003B63A322